MSKERMKTLVGLTKATFVLLLAAALCMHAQLPAPQAENPSQSTVSIRVFFQKLIENPSPLPRHEELLRVTDQMAVAPEAEITNALPAIFAALSHPNDEVKIYAAAALFEVSRRADSAKLLRSYIRPISGLFDCEDARLQGTPALIFVNLRPEPPPEVVQPLLMYIKRTDRDANAQAGALGALAELAPENPEVLEAVRAILRRPLDSKARINTLNALGGKPRLRDSQIVALVARSLDDPDQWVRFTAAQTLQRMGEDAVRQAEPALQKVILRGDEAPEVKDAAREALKTIGRSD